MAARFDTELGVAGGCLFEDATLSGDGMSKKKRDKELEALFKARDELVAEGELVRVEEIDPATGKLRWRYFHKIYAPKPH